MLQTDGTQINHSIHLWPITAARRIVNAIQAKNRLKRGMRFSDGSGNPITLRDLPAGAKVIVHCNNKSRLALRVN